MATPPKTTPVCANTQISVIKRKPFKAGAEPQSTVQLEVELEEEQDTRQQTFAVTIRLREGKCSV